MTRFDRVRSAVSTLCVSTVVASALVVGVGALATPAHAAGTLATGPSGQVTVAETVGSTTYVGGVFEGVGKQTGGGAQVSKSSTGTVDATFPAIDGNVADVVSDGNDGWYIVGEFTKVGDQVRNGAARILSDGSVDATFNPPAPIGSYSDVLFDGTNVVVAGSFIGYGELPEPPPSGQPWVAPDFYARPNVAQFNASGELTSWAPAFGEPYAGSPVEPAYVSSVVLSGGHLYVGGSFNVVNGTARTSLAAITYATGALDATWNPVIDGGDYPAQVDSLALSAGVLYFGGTFAEVSTVDRINAAAVTADTTLAATVQAWDPSPNAGVSSILVSGSDVYLGGSFTELYSYEPDSDDRLSRNRIAQVDTASGTADLFFNPNSNGDIAELALVGGDLYAVGGFTNIGGSDRLRAARLETTLGTADSWNPEPLGDATLGLTPVLRAIAVNPSVDAAYIGGNFRVVNGTERKFFAVFDENGGLEPETVALDQQPTFLESNGGDLYMSGYFTEVNSTPVSGLVRFDLSDMSLDATWLPEVNLPVRAMLFDSGNDLAYLGGFFTEVEGETRNFAASLSLSAGTVGTWNPDATAVVDSLDWAPTGNILVGGSFYAQYPTDEEPDVNPGIGGKERTYIAELDTDGVATDWALEVDGPVTLARTTGDNILLAGGFTAVATEDRQGLALVDFEEKTLLPWNPEMDGAVLTAQVINDIVYIAGDFTVVAGEERNRVAALSPVSGLPTSWNPSVFGPVGTIAGDDVVFLGGQFTASGPTLNASFGLVSPLSQTPPYVSEYGPIGGSIAGGTAVTFTGTDLADATVTFDGASATLTSNTATEIVAESPAHAAGAVEVVVSTDGGLIRYPEGFSYYTGPVITGVEPAVGPLEGGNIIYIAGENFAGTDVVQVGGVDATDFWYLEDEGVLEVTVPEAALPGVVDIFVSNPAGEFTAPEAYEYLAAPSVTAVTPSAGSTTGGTSVTITGEALTHTSAVTFGALEATDVVVVDDQTVTATTPGGGVGAADVTVTTPGGTATAVGGYTYMSAPTVTSVTPSGGPVAGGTEVTIVGTNLGIVNGVSFGATPATSFVAVDSTTVTAVAPAGSAGQVNVSVTTPVATATATNAFRYFATPVVSNVAPAAGPTAGSTAVVITGTNLSQTSAVTFGGNSASFQQNSATQVTAYAPAGAAGAVDLAVTTPGGTTTVDDGYTYVAAPTLSGIAPTSGSEGGGTVVTVTGTNLSTVSSVTFGTTQATIDSASDTELTVTTGAHAQGVVNVVAATPGGTAQLTGAYTYLPGPTISSVSPAVGPQAGGTSVTITGTNLADVDTARFGGVDGTVTGTTATTVTVTSPAAGSAGVVAVSVGSPDGTASRANAFTYVAAPTITSVTPAEGQEGGGDTVVIAGTNLANATGVTIGGTAATIGANTATSVTVTTPAGTAGAQDVAVTTVGGTGTSVGAFTYVAGPSVTTVAPAGGPVAGGNSVTLTGTNLADASSVTIGGVAATISTNTDTELVVTAPPRAAGAVDVVVVTPGGSNTRSNAYRYTNPASVSSISPTAGPLSGGQTVTITGSNLWGASGVTIAGIAATNVTVVSGTEVTAVTAASSATTGTVSVTGFGGTATSTQTYTYTAEPVFTSVTPPTGPTAGGQSVVIAGENLAGVTGVLFDGDAAEVTAQTGSSLTVVTPANTVGVVDVTLQSPGGDVVGEDAYEYVLSPTITSVAPATGPISGLSDVVITGTNLEAATAVNFGAVAGTITATTATTITVDAPAQAAGTVEVAVVTPNGSVASADAFTYLGLPAVTAISPSAGSTLGGTTVTFTGTSLSGVTEVEFGAEEATIVSASNNALVVTTPAQAAGEVQVSITSPGGVVPNAGTFTYVAPPTLTSIDPSNGSTNGGTAVTLTGTNLSGVTSVTFGGTAAQVQSTTSTTVSVVTPARPAGSAAIVATSGGGSATLSGAFAYIAPVPPNPELPANVAAVVMNPPKQFGSGKPYTFAVETRTPDQRVDSASAPQTRSLIAANGYVVVKVSGGVECTAVILNGYGKCTAVVPAQSKAVVTTQFFHFDGTPAGVGASTAAIPVTPVAINSVKTKIKGCAVNASTAGVAPKARQKVQVQVKAGGGWRTYVTKKANGSAKWSTTVKVKKKSFKMRAVVGKKKSGSVSVRAVGKLCR